MQGSFDDFGRIARCIRLGTAGLSARLPDRAVAGSSEKLLQDATKA
jgi:hypothetical protein